MSVETDDVPTVHAVFLYSTDNALSDEMVTLGDSFCPKLSNELKKTMGKKLSGLANEYRKKFPSPTVKEFDLNDKKYSMYILQASSVDKAVFFCDSTSPASFYQELKIDASEPSLLALPFLDGALLRFLERSQVYGLKQKNLGNKTPRSHRIATVKEQFSLEEVFRVLDVDGNGSIDIHEWKAGLQPMLASQNVVINDQDIELVFKTISEETDELTFQQFYSFFDGNALSRRRRQVINAFASFTPNFAATKQGLGTLAEDMIDLNEHDMKEEPETTSGKPQLTAQQSETSKHMENVKSMIRECLNLGDDYQQFKGVNSPQSVSSLKFFDSTPIAMSGSSGQLVTAQDIDVTKAMIHIQSCEDLLDIMVNNLYHCPLKKATIKWENRYKSHKLRLNNFQKILNEMLSSKMQSMTDENRVLLSQLDSIRGDSYQNDVLMNMADLHNQQLHSLASPMSKKSKAHMRSKSSQSNLRSKNRNHIRTKSNRSNRSGTSGTYSDDDCSSVDSEVNLVYVPGTKLSSKESEILMKRVVTQKREMKKMKKESKKLKEDLKKQEVRARAIQDQLNTKIQSMDKKRMSVMNKSSKLKSDMLHMRKSQKRTSGLNLVDATEAANQQRTISALKKQLKNVQNELEAEQERKRTVQKKLQRHLERAESGSNNDNVKRNSISKTKMKRWEKDKKNLEAEVVAKQKKMDDMFLKRSALDRKNKKLDTENGELKAKLGSWATQIKQIKKRTAELDSITDDRDRASRECRQLNEKVTKLNERVQRLKGRNRRFKERIKNLLETIDDYEKLLNEQKRIMKEYSDMNAQLNALESESAKHKNQNQDLNEQIRKLRTEMKIKKLQLDKTSDRLESLKDNLSSEYSTIQRLEKEIDDQNEMVNDLNEKINENESNDEELQIQIIRLQAQVEQSDKALKRYRDKLERKEKEIDELNEKYMNYKENKMMKASMKLKDLEEDLQNKNDEIKMLKEKIDKLLNMENEYNKMHDQMKDRNDELDELMNKIEKLNDKLSNEKEKYKQCVNEKEEWERKFKSMQLEYESQKSKIGKLNIKVSDFERAKMKESDEVTLKLKQYKTQVILIDENKKEIEKLTNLLGAERTKNGLIIEENQRHKNRIKGHDEELGDKNDEIYKQKKKIEKFKKQLDGLGFGDNKVDAELKLLRKNVDTLESNVRDKKFEIKKLKLKLKNNGIGDGSSGSNSNANDVKKIKELKNECEKMQRQNKKKTNDLKAKREEMKEMEGMLNTKNEEIVKIKNKLAEMKDEMNEKGDLDNLKKENENLKEKLNKLSSNSNEIVDEMKVQMDEMKEDFEKHQKKLSVKIDKLEADCSIKDDLILQFKKQFNTNELYSSETIDEN